MAYIRSRTTSSGEVRYNVRWREGGVQRTATAATLEDAERIKAHLDVHGTLQPVQPRVIRPGIDPAETPSFAAAARAHLDQLTGVWPRTVADYRRDLRVHFSPILQLPVDQVDRDVIASLIRYWQDGGAASKTIANWHGLLSAIMTTSVRRGWVTANPCAGVRLPRHDEHLRVDPCFLTEDEYAHLLSFVPQWWRPLVETLASTGMRWGEAAALRVGDVSTSPPSVAISKSVKRDPDEGMVIGPTKTRRSRRVVEIGPSLLAQLQPLVVDRAADEPLFTAPEGGRVKHSAFYKQVWAPARELALAARRADGMPVMTRRPRIHDLRHSNASWLIAAGIDLVVVQRRLGHESIKTTIDTYSHLHPDAQKGAAAALEAAMARRGTTAAVEAS